MALYLAGGATVVLGLLGWGAVAAMDSSIGPPDNHVAKSDSRVCPATTGNNLEYADAVRHFGLSVPKDAAAWSSRRTGIRCSVRIHWICGSPPPRAISPPSSP
ncbi:hypothetical protein ACFQ1I_02870 [Kitasatospora arboriphila]